MFGVSAGGLLFLSIVVNNVVKCCGDVDINKAPRSGHKGVIISAKTDNGGNADVLVLSCCCFVVILVKG